MALASEVWTAAFKAHFIPFWLFAQTHQLRVYRLDSTQHAAIHTMNAATRLVSNLPEAELLAVQRKALDNPSAGILTISEVAEEIGIDGKISMPPNGCTRSALDGACMLGDAGPIQAARLLAYARTAWLSEEVLIYDLGEKTKRLQTAALRKRLKLTDDMPLPVHPTHLCCCTECQ